MAKFLDDNGLLYLWSKIKAIVPKKTSDLTNDSGFITTSDIPEGAAASTTTPKMDGTAAVGAELAFARGDHIHPSDTKKVDKVDGKGLSTEDYTTAEKNKLAGIEAGANVSPTKLSQLENDKGFLTSHQDISGKADKATTLSGYGITDAYTKTQVDGLVSGTFHYKGTKATYSELPTSGNAVGDVWNITAADASHNVKAGDNVAWNGSGWDVLSGVVDLSAYVQYKDVITNAEIDTIVAT